MSLRQTTSEGLHPPEGQSPVKITPSRFSGWEPEDAGRAMDIGGDRIGDLDGGTACKSEASSWVSDIFLSVLKW